MSITPYIDMSAAIEDFIRQEVAKRSSVEQALFSVECCMSVIGRAVGAEVDALKENREKGDLLHAVCI